MVWAYAKLDNREILLFSDHDATYCKGPDLDTNGQQKINADGDLLWKPTLNLLLPDGTMWGDVGIDFGTQGTASAGEGTSSY